jgi:hypothetical protein
MGKQMIYVVSELMNQLQNEYVTERAQIFRTSGFYKPTLKSAVSCNNKHLDLYSGDVGFE